MMPIDHAAIERYWDTVAGLLDCGELVLLGLESAGRVVFTVQLAPCMKDNGRHRAELQKLLVESRVRRRGFGRVLLAAAEARARQAGWWLLLLDTRGASAAEGLYGNNGWIAVGSIPDYARDPDGRLADCTFFYKRLDAATS